MSACHTIDNIQYNIYFENEKLCVKAIHFKSLTDYKLEICNEDIQQYKLVDSLEELYEMLDDAFSNIVDNKESNDVNLVIEFDKKKNEIHLTMTIGFKYKSENINFIMVTEKELINQQIIDNKMTYFNKKLNDLEDMLQIIDSMQKQINKQDSRIRELEYENEYGRKQLNYGVHYLILEEAKSLSINSASLSIVGVVCLFGVNISKQHILTFMDDLQMLNRLYNLETITITNISTDQEYSRLFVDLSFIEECRNIKTVTLNNIPNLYDISALSNFHNMETLTITECRKIQNLEVIEQCKSLQLLKIQSVMNTGVFSNNLHFRIEIMQ